MKFLISSLVTAVVVMFATAATLLADTYTVTNTADTLTAGTLRQAITDANAHANSLNPGSVPDRIEFAIPGAGVKTISPASLLPIITDPVVIDGTTQGASATPLIELNFTSVGTYGLWISAGASTVRGLAINRAPRSGIYLTGSGGNTIEGNFVGTDPSGTIARPNGEFGVFVDGPPNNLIGGTTTAARNLVSGNIKFAGIAISGSTATNNRVEGNYVGTDVTGTVALKNNNDGIYVGNSSGVPGSPSNCTVGGTTSGAGNLVSGNGGNGVEIYGPNASGNVVQGNFIGTNAAGTALLGNSGDGVNIGDASGGHTIGGTVAGARNIISGNGTGVHVVAYGTQLTAGNNLVQGNYIGTDVNGTAALGNVGDGVNLESADHNTIGGTGVGQGNLISGNNGDGISISGATATNNSVQGNLIGTDVSGTADLGNIHNGAQIGSAANNTIGGTASGARNIISGNDENGVSIFGSAATTNLVQGNFIGTDINGTAGLGNTNAGVYIFGAPSNTIGGSATGAGNLISDNNAGGIFVTGATAQNNQVSANSIFSNGGLGIDLEDDGVTPNDLGDGDTGANVLQNFPVLTSASTSGGNTTINGSLNSTANTTFRIEFFASAKADPSGYGEGQTFLGFTNATTDNNGNVTFSAVLPVLPPAGQTIITATASDNLANTSEFSAAIQLAGTSGQLLNISTRADVLTTDDVEIVGFIITGTDPKQVIIRALGPSLANANPPVAGALADPTLELHDHNGDLVVSNDDWKSDQQTEIENTGFAPSNDLESAIVRTLTPQAYTAVMRGKNDSTGVGLIEVYDLSPDSNSTLANISTRGFVGTDDNVLIGGVIAGRGGSGSVKAIVRAIGPSLSSFGVSDPLADPTLELHDANGILLISNDNWKETQQSEIEATHFQPSSDLESAIVTFLPPGPTTAIVRGKNNATGVALVEVYRLP